MKTRLRFLSPGEMKFVPRKIWKKSTSVQYQPDGGYFRTVNSQVLDLTLLFGDFIKQFNENSRSVYSASGFLTLDEILSKAKSRKNPIKQYNQSKKTD